MVHSLHFFKSITSSIQISVRLPNGDIVKVTHIGTVQVSASLLLENVLCIPSFSFNLISISKLTQNSSCCYIILSNFCFLQDLQHWKMIGFGKKQGGLYTLQCTSQVTLPDSVSKALSLLSSYFHGKSVNSCNLDSSDSVFRLWHYRLGHPSSQRLTLLNNIVPDIKSCNNTKPFDCHICPLAKQHKLPFTHSNISLSCFDLVHADIWGPYSTPSLNGSKYFLTLVDDHNRCAWVYLLKQKSDVSTLIPSFFHMILTQFKVPIKVFRSNNGLEFALSSFYASKGIINQLSYVETSQQNAVVERKHRLLLNVARALRFQANLP